MNTQTLNVTTVLSMRYTDNLMNRNDIAPVFVVTARLR